MCEQPSDKNDLIKRIQELEDRKTEISLKKIQLELRLKNIEKAEAQLRREEEFAASADRILARRSFIDEICRKYENNRRLMNSIESLAEAAYGTIQVLYPTWMVDPVALTSVASMCGIVLSKKTMDVFCGLVSK